MNNSLLWKIEHENLETVSYLFGTIHAYDPEIICLPPSLFELIRKCDLVAFELDLTKFNYQEVAARMYIQDEDINLKSLLSDSVYTKLIQKVNEEDILKCKPLYVNNFLFKADVKQSVEDKIWEFCKENLIPVCGLETVSEQLDVLDSIPLSIQAEILENSISDSSDLEGDLKEMIKAYSNQDFEEMKHRAKLLEKYTKFMEDIHANRNNTMCNRLINILNTKATFAAIGALHLVDLSNHKGMLRILQDRDFTVTPIPLDFRVKTPNL